MFAIEGKNPDGSRAKLLYVEVPVACWVTTEQIHNGKKIDVVVGLIPWPSGGPLISAENDPRFLGYASPEDAGFQGDKSRWHALADEVDRRLLEVQTKQKTGESAADSADDET